jgi:hypothetical protein
MTTDTTLIAGVARAAMLVNLKVGLYSGRKKDTRTQAEVVSAKGSNSSRAASVYKALFADCKELEAIVKFQARARKQHYTLTLPWDDAGARLLPVTALAEYQNEMSRCRNEFDRLVQTFLDKYDTLVAAAAFQLGALFDRSEYPKREAAAKQFGFDVQYSPLPIAGDFRLDIETEVQNDLARQYEQRLQAQLASAQQDAWTRVHEALTRFQDRLQLNEDGTRKIFHDTMVHNAQELCEVLTHLNVTRDPALEKAREQLQTLLAGVDVQDLRKEEGARLTTLQSVNQILDAFDWGTE